MTVIVIVTPGSLIFLFSLFLIPFASPRSQGTGRGECTYSTSVENFVSRSLLHIDYIISRKYTSLSKGYELLYNPGKKNHGFSQTVLRIKLRNFRSYKISLTRSSIEILLHIIMHVINV